MAKKKKRPQIHVITNSLLGSAIKDLTKSCKIEKKVIRKFTARALLKNDAYNINFRIPTDDFLIVRNALDVLFLLKIKSRNNLRGKIQRGDLILHIDNFPQYFPLRNLTVSEIDSSNLMFTVYKIS